MTHGVKLRLGDVLGLPHYWLRVSTALTTGRAQAADRAGLGLGTGPIFGFAVGGLCRRFRPMRSNLAHTALRLCPSRSAICPALWPLVQSAVSSATSEAFHSMGDGLYTKHEELRKGWRH
jgi:hypothetical protein